MLSPLAPVFEPASPSSDAGAASDTTAFAAGSAAGGAAAVNSTVNGKTADGDAAGSATSHSKADAQRTSSSGDELGGERSETSHKSVRLLCHIVEV